MKAIRFLFSMPFMIFLTAFYAIAIGAATFIEDAHGTETARALIYNARWLEALYLLLGVNLMGNAIRFKLWKRNKWPIGLFHIAFLIILTGAAVTRYMGYSGTLHFREGESTNQLYTDKACLQIQTQSGNEIKTEAFPLLLSSITRNRWQKNIITGFVPIKVQLKQFIPKAIPAIIEDPTGGPILMLTVSEGEQAIPLFLRPGEKEGIGKTVFGFERDVSSQKNHISLIVTDNQISVQSDVEMVVISMRQRQRFILAANQPIQLEPGLVFRIENLQFAMKSFTPQGRITAKAATMDSPNNESYSALLINVSQGGSAQDIALFGGVSIAGVPENITLNGTNVTLTYGSVLSTLPFHLRLNDFIIERYPGSRMPSTYESQITILDPEFGIERPYRIYMNHILKYRNYRFYQSSYDTDELGSILSVTRDPGTPITYVGYALLILCLIINIFNSRSRFRKLGRQLRTPILMIFAFILGASNVRAQKPASSEFPINKNHANQFGKLIVQDNQGRMKPVNSLAHELLRDLSHPERISNLSPNQWILQIYVESNSIEDLPIIPLKHAAINHRLDLSSDVKFAKPSAFYHQTGQYLLEDWTRQAETIQKNKRSALENEILKIHACLNIIHNIKRGDVFRIFPISKNAAHWISDLNPQLNSEIKSQILEYKQSVRSGQWDKANELLTRIADYQTEYGKSLISSSFRRGIEVFYNEAYIFQRLSPLFLWLGLLFFPYLMMILIKPGWMIKRVEQILTILLLTGFGLQTLGLALRWIASGHAPWTNKYESMIYIAWAIMLSGVMVIKNNRFPISLAAILAGGILKAAHMAWADPKITNLMPVLKSHWLITHVSVITASYGFFGLSAMLGMLILTILCFIPKNDHSRKQIQQLTWMNERAMLIGLTLVTIGNLLGAIWANESWGRYWGWDPKETWTLIVILIYAIIIHFRYIRGISYTLSTSIGSALAFWAVLMTYIGVNFYLSGIHSYAAGEAPPIPKVIFVIMSIQILVVIWAMIKNR